MARVLVTCVGSGVGQSVIDSLNIVGGHFIVGCDSNRNVYAYQFCNKFQIVPSIYSEGYVDHMLKLCIENQIDVIIPGHDQELLILANNISRFEEKNIKVIVSGPEIIEISRDKYKWYKFFSSKGCSIVPTFKVDEFRKNPDPSIFPTIIKPSGGSASQGILILNNISELENASDSDIIQPYLFPKKDDSNYETIRKYVEQGKFVQMSEISIQLIFTKDSVFSEIFISKNILKSGVPVFVDPIVPNEFVYLDEIMKFVPILEQNQARGPVNIQGRITDKGLIFFEMNMRFTGITGNRAQLGFNEVDFLVKRFIGIPSQMNGYAINKLGVRQVACTTIPRLKNEQKNLTISIINLPYSIGMPLVQELIKNDMIGDINIVKPNTIDHQENRILNPKVKYFSSDENFLQSVYCQTDVLFFFIGFNITNPSNNLAEEIRIQLSQLVKVIKSNISYIISVSGKQEIHAINSSLDENPKNDSLDLVTVDLLRSISSFNPSINFKEITINNNKKSDLTVILPEYIKELFDTVRIN